MDGGSAFTRSIVADAMGVESTVYEHLLLFLALSLKPFSEMVRREMHRSEHDNVQGMDLEDHIKHMSAEIQQKHVKHFFAYLHERGNLMQLRAATLKLMLWFRSECIKMEEDEGEYSNAHSEVLPRLFFS